MTREQVQKKAVDIITQYNCHGIIEVYMRVGKSKIAIETILANKKNISSILWVTNEKGLRDNGIPEQILTWGNQELLDKCDIKLYGALNKLKKSYDFVILDECQHLTLGNVKYFKSQAKMPHVLAMTGFMPKDKEKLEILHSVLNLNLLFTYTHEEAIKDKIVSDYQINILMINLSAKEQEEHKSINKLLEIAITGNNKNWIKHVRIARQRFLHSLPSKVKVAKELLKQNETERIICFSPTKKIAEEISPAFFHSTSSSLAYNNFQTNISNILSAVSKGSTGHTFKEMGGIILLGADNNQNGLLSQKIARSFIWRKDYTAQIYILIAAGTQEEIWLKNGLSSYNVSKVKTKTI